MNDLTADRIDGPICDGDRRMFWTILPPQRWSFQSLAAREQLILDAAGQYAQLVGRRIHTRVTTRPYPVEQWGKALDADTPDPLPGWPAYLAEEQIHMHDLNLADKLVYLGVELLTPRIRHKRAEEEVREIETIIAGPGLNGRAVTPAEMEFLMHRSCGVGAPAPLTLAPPRSEWAADDLGEFTDSVHWSTKPFDRSVLVEADVNGAHVTRNVVVATLSRIGALEIPERWEPWMQRADRLPFPVEWSIITDVIDSDTTRKSMRDTMARATAQIEHYAEHRLPSPMDLMRQMKKALTVEEEIGDGDPLATRTHSWIRAAMSGRDETEALDRARKFTELYAPVMTFHTGVDQHARLREFIPGEPLSTTAHRRHLDVKILAAGVPAASALVGDKVGFLLGRTAGTSAKAALRAPHRNMEVREGSGATLIAGVPGAGKSVHIGKTAYDCAMAGVRSIILDPSGPLGRLTTRPELAPYSRTIDLMNAEPGELGPYRVIGEPRPENHLADREDGMTDEAWRDANDRLYRRAVIAAASRRRTLCQDILATLLPASIARQQETMIVLQQATKRVGGSIHNDARMVLDTLTDMGGHAAMVAGMLEDIAELPQAQLIFASAGEAPSPVDTQDWMLQVFTMRGNVLPKPDTDREDWSIEERIGVPLLLLASRLTVQHIYLRPMSERKLLGLDEMHAFMDIASGRALVNGVVRDSRKWNLRALLGSQNVEDQLTAGIANFIGDVLIGQTIDLAAQEAALRVLGVELGVGYEKVLGSLMPQERGADRRLGYRHMVYADGMGGIEKISLHWPERLRAVLDTTAAPDQAPRDDMIGVVL